MKKYPAIALIEFSSIAAGIRTGDEMLKKAPIAVIKSGTVHNGKYLILIGGSVASVEESYQIGLNIEPTQIIDYMMLPDVHHQLHDGILGLRSKCTAESLGVIETSSVSTMLRATDAGIKGANVNLIEIRLADDIGGKAFTVLNGSLEEIQAAIDIAKSAVNSSENWINDIIIPNMHYGIKQQIEQSTSFAKVKLDNLTDSEA